MENKIAKRYAVCYCTDIGFLLPSIVSANSLRRFLSVDNVDIIIFTIDVPKTVIDSISASPHLSRIKLIQMDREWSGSFDQTKYDQRIPDASLGRLFLHKYLNRSYDRVMYIDGDTFVSGDVYPALIGQIPNGFVAGVCDSVWFSRRDVGGYGVFVRKYLSSLRFDAKDIYLNCGVVIADFDTWSNVSEEAFRYFCGNVELCYHHDQTAFNIVSAHHKLKISTRWNAISAFVEKGVELHVKPVIRHYTGKPKPWNSSEDEDVAYKQYYRSIKSGVLASSIKDTAKSYRVEAERLQMPSVIGRRMYDQVMRPVWSRRFAAYESQSVF